jgi:hypothetical protein
MGLRDHLRHRLNPKTILKEAFSHFTDKVLPHGADEVGNLLFSGSAYLPWPGKGGPAPIAPPETTVSTEAPPDTSLYGTVLPPDPIDVSPISGAWLEGPIVEGDVRATGNIEPLEWRDQNLLEGYNPQPSPRGDTDRSRGFSR